MTEIDMKEFAGHTPGPWGIEDCWIESDSGRITAVLRGNASDGALIAAAPTLLSKVKRQAAEIEQMRAALESIKAWADAYPLESFPEPHRFEWQQAAALLSEKGISLGNMSASNIRHVINGVRQFVASGLGSSND